MSFHNFTTGHGHSFGGEYVELVPNERIRYTDRFDDPNLPGVLEVTVTLKPVVCGTELKHHPGRHSRGHPARDVLPRLAGIARAAGDPRRARHPGLGAAMRLT